MTGRAAKFSRSGVTSPLGKCDSRLDVPMSGELKEALSVLATLKGGGVKRPAAEYARQILEEHAFGVLPLIRRKLGQSSPGDDGTNIG
jgi:hypothetical protein